MFKEEMALRATRLAETQQESSPVDVASLELAHGEAEEFRSALEVLFRQINVPLLITTVDATELAFKSKIGHECDGEDTNRIAESSR